MSDAAAELWELYARRYPGDRYERIRALRRHARLLRPLDPRVADQIERLPDVAGLGGPNSPVERPEACSGVQGASKQGKAA
jgi:hypothetical protein